MEPSLGQNTDIQPKEPLSAKEADDMLGVVFHPVLKDPALTTPESPAGDRQKQKPAQFGSPIHTENASHIGILRTYRGDIEDTMKTQNVSAVSIAVAENNRRIMSGGATIDETPIENRKGNRLFFATSGILVGLGVLAVVFAFFFRTETPAPSTIVTAPSLISPETQKELALIAEDAKRSVLLLRDRVDRDQVRLNTIEQVYLTEKAGATKTLVSATRFIELSGWKTPDQLTRSFAPIFMFGIHAFDHNQPFLIFKTASYETAFAGMIEWEKTMPRDLAALFALPESAVASGTTPLGSLSKNTGFKDMVVRNKDVRTWNGADGLPLIMYSFFDKNTIVITTSEYTLKEVLLRLSRTSVTQ